MLNYFMLKCIRELLYLQAVISSEEEEGHQGRIDRKVLFRYKQSNVAHL